MINIAKLLKNCPKGTKLYSPLFGEVELIGVNNDSTKIRVIYNQCFPKDFLSDGRYLDFPDAECLLFPSSSCRDWKKWKAPTSPKFKVHDWIIYDKSFTIPIQVIGIKDKVYVCKSIEGLVGNYGIKITDSEYHLWTIADAKNGDVFVTEDYIFIFKYILHGGVHLYCHYDIDAEEFDLDIPDAIIGNIHDKGAHFKPATKEQYILLFAKMQEAGYEWDDDKKELRKIKPHYDIANFYAGMPVLVRADNVCRWDYSLFSRITGNDGWPFAVCNGVSFSQCIPYNDYTKHLLGTTDMCDEQYINW